MNTWQIETAMNDLKQMPRMLTCLHFYVGEAGRRLGKPDVLDGSELPEGIVKLDPRALLTEPAHEDLTVLVPLIVTRLVPRSRLSIDQSDHELVTSTANQCYHVRHPRGAAARHLNAQFLSILCKTFSYFTVAKIKIDKISSSPKWLTL